MDTLSVEQLQTLSERRNPNCVSLFMPALPAGRETRQDPILLKDLLREAERKMIAAGVPKSTVERILGPARELSERADFWREQSNGLVIYLSDNFFQSFRLPLEFTARTVLSDRFEVTPLMPLFAAGGRFYLLALSLEQARLFEGSVWRLKEFEAPHLPAHLSDALNLNLSQRRPPVVKRDNRGMFHGQPGEDDRAKDKIRAHFQRLDRALHEVLKDPWAPLVLAGVEELFPIYREANTWQLLVEGGIPGSWKSATLHDLHQEALRAVRPFFEKARVQAVETFRSLVGTGKASDQLAEIVPAAFAGQILYALVRPDAQSWGRFEPDENRVEMHDQPEPGDEDLVNAIAIQTILHRGAVYSVSPTELPSASPAAAVFRYA